MNEDCLACKSLSGEKRISPGPTIFEGKYWVVEHAYPVKETGWIVIVHKEHIESLDKLKLVEWHELIGIINSTIAALKSATGCEKEYVLCLSEGKGFQHIHFHVIARPKDLPIDFSGIEIFKWLKDPLQDLVPPQVIIDFCAEIIDKFKTPS
ncbi:MAG: hypothetical protein PHC97_04375 [Patescibacteria group bacterium]|nr:hypothetical protein [Patescibacteria group bacterium]